MMSVNNAPFILFITFLTTARPSTAYFFHRLLSPVIANGHGTMLHFPPGLRKVMPTPPSRRHWFSFSCFTACNRSTSGTFYVPIFLSVHSSFSATLLASVLAGACNTARSFIATCLLNLTHATFVAAAFLPLFLLDHFIRGFVSGSQPHSRHESFIDPRPIDRTIHLWTAFHISI